MSSMGGGGSSGPTPQQQQLETMQATTTANLNLEENAQRKSILNAMLGTRVFRGSALSRALRGNTPGTGGEAAAPAPSRSQINAGSASPPISVGNTSLLDQREAGTTASGNTPAGGTGPSGRAAAVGIGGYRGGGGSRGGPAP
jgi:hypothetical protein